MKTDHLIQSVLASLQIITRKLDGRELDADQIEELKQIDSTLDDISEALNDA